MPILNEDGEITNDIWTQLADDAPIENDAHIIVSSHRLIRDWADLNESAAEIGVFLESNAVIENLTHYLSRLSLIALRFESFADGRAFSQASLLRQRYHFTGDIRATGEVIRDQLDFMRRCGFNQFEIEQKFDAAGASQAFREIPLGYQTDVRIQPG